MTCTFVTFYKRPLVAVPSMSYGFIGVKGCFSSEYGQSPTDWPLHKVLISRPQM